MRLFVKFMLLIVVIAMAGPFFLKGPDGRALWSIKETVEAAKALPGQALPNALPGLTPASDAVQVYRWQDADGQWHYAGEPPAGIASESLVIDRRTNAIGTAPAAPAPTEEVAAAAETDPHAMHIAPLVPLPDPVAVQELLEDIEALKATAEARASAID